MERIEPGTEKYCSDLGENRNPSNLAILKIGYIRTTITIGILRASKSLFLAKSTKKQSNFTEKFLVS